MSQLSPYQYATKGFFIFMSTVIFLIGAGALFMMKNDSFNPGWIFFIVLTIFGLFGMFYGAGWIASKFRKDLPEGNNKAGLQPNFMDKEMQNMEFRQLPSLIVAIIGLIGLLLMKHNNVQIIYLQIYTSCILVALGSIGIIAYKYALFVVYPKFSYGTTRCVWRGQTAKKYGKILLWLSIIGLIFFWIILPLLLR